MSELRDERGLVKGIEYVFRPDGAVDWRAMIPSEYLVINKDYKDEITARYNKAFKDLDPREVEDRYLLILLGGIKHVLRLRGFVSVEQRVEYCDQYKCVNTCTIKFTPNFETDGAQVIFSDTASASVDSTSGVFRLFIESIAANRAFVRCVRNFLGINIVGKDEFDDRANKTYSKLGPAPEEAETTGYSARHFLEKRCKELDKDGSHSFDKIKARATELKAAGKTKIESNPEEWIDFSSINDKDAYVLLVKINEAAKKKK